mgnify:CR=1 FL=1
MAPASAHHSFAMFDAEKSIELKGTVKEFQYTNPHSWLLVDVKDPRPMGPAFADALTGLYAAYGILGALQAREKTGRGQRVETSLVQGTMAFMNEPFAGFFASGRAPSTAFSAARASRSSVMRCPASICSTACTRHGIGATPPSTTRALLHDAPSICSTAATATTACVHASRSSTFRYVLRVPATGAGTVISLNTSPVASTFSLVCRMENASCAARRFDNPMYKDEFNVAQFLKPCGQGVERRSE